MLKYIGRTLEGALLAFSTEKYVFYELYSENKPYKIRRVVTKLAIDTFKNELLQILKTDVLDKQNIILNFINNSTYITPKLHQLDLILTKRYRIKILEKRPYTDATDFTNKTCIRFVNYFSKLSYTELTSNTYKLINLLKSIDDTQ